MAVGSKFEALRGSRLRAVVLGEVKSEVAGEAALDDPVSHLLRWNAHCKIGMSFIQGVPAIEPVESRDPETIVKDLIFLL
jgi:hypothetical protein